MRNTHIGIIGGGQLGMLLARSAMQFPARVSVYDPDARCSAAHFTDRFTQGAFSDRERLVAFGSDCDALIFETEKVNADALKMLEEQGKTILSRWQDLEWIQDKYVQKSRLAEAGFPVPAFQEVSSAAVRDYSGPFPVVQKWKKEGYDGMGVTIHRGPETIAQAAKVESVFEELVDIRMELSVILARDGNGNIAVFEPVEMVFDSQANLVDHLIAPARISQKLAEAAKDICREIASRFDFRGVYAVELFLDQNDRILVNEISPRPHNSGHHTVAANVTSQYDQQIRLALGLPLGSTDQLSPCVMVNLLAENASGKTLYQGLPEAYAIPNVEYCFYGKTEVRPRRKMGHALILEHDIDAALAKAGTIRNTLTITSHE